MNLMVANAMRCDDDVVLLRPHAVIELPVHETPTACAGAAASYVLRRVAYRAGALAPGIQEAIFGELHTSHHGATLGSVERWIVEREPALHALGYRIEHGRSASRSCELIAWLAAGRGYRGAVLATRYELIAENARANPRSIAPRTDLPSSSSSRISGRRSAVVLHGRAQMLADRLSSRWAAETARAA